MTSPYAFALGVLAGIIFTGMMTHWVALLGVILGRHGGDFLGAPKRRLLWAAPLATVAHPAPFLIAAALAGGVMAGLDLLQRPWGWLFAGFYLYLGFIALVVLKALSRSTRKRH